MDGALDFTETDFSSRVYALAGEWEFYFDRLYIPDDFAGGAPEDRELISLPGPWLKNGYPGLGHGSYRLTIHTGSDAPLTLCCGRFLSGWAAPWGQLFVPGIIPNLFIIMSQCVMLSRNYAQARAEAERVNVRLEELVGAAHKTALRRQ